MFVFRVLSAFTQAYRVNCKDKCYHLTKAGKKDAKLANYRFSAGIVNRLRSKREGLQLATLGMYA